MKRKASDPVWDEVLNFEVGVAAGACFFVAAPRSRGRGRGQLGEDDATLYLVVWDHEVVRGNSFLGRVVVDLSPLFRQMAVTQGERARFHRSLSVMHVAGTVALEKDLENHPDVQPRGMITFEVNGGLLGGGLLPADDDVAAQITPQYEQASASPATSPPVARDKKQSSPPLPKEKMKGLLTRFTLKSKEIGRRLSDIQRKRRVDVLRASADAARKCWTQRFAECLVRWLLTQTPKRTR